MAVTLKTAVIPRKGATIVMPGEVISLPKETEEALIAAGKAERVVKARTRKTAGNTAETGPTAGNT